MNKYFVIHSFIKIFIGVWLIYNVVLASGVQQSESDIHIHIVILFQILFPDDRSLQSIEQISLYYTIDPYQLSILYIIVQSQPPNSSLSFCFSPLITISLFSISATVCFLLNSLVYFTFQNPHVSNIIQYLFLSDLFHFKFIHVATHSSMLLHKTKFHVFMAE